jgi:hypothetical protein
VTTETREHVVAKWHRCLDAWDWEGFASTMTEDVGREGPEGSYTDAITGRDGYVELMAGTAGRQFEYSFKPDRIIYSEDGRAAVSQVQTRFVLTEGSEPISYRLVLVFDVNDDDLIDYINIYWKDPTNRVPSATVADYDAGNWDENFKEQAT